jgi:predicted O-methyltransferase YrrM
MIQYIEQSRDGATWKRPVSKVSTVAQACELEVLSFLYVFTLMTKPDRVLEIGTFEGESAKAMGSALQENKRGKLRTIDITDNGQLQNLKHLQEIVKVIVCLPEEVRINSGRGAPYDMVFIDDGHEMNDVYRDLRIANDFIKKDGYIIGHDAYEISVQRGLQKFTDENGELYEQMIVKSLNGIFILRRR